MLKCGIMCSLESVKYGSRTGSLYFYGMMIDFYFLRIENSIQYLSLTFFSFFLSCSGTHCLGIWIIPNLSTFHCVIPIYLLYLDHWERPSGKHLLGKAIKEEKDLVTFLQCTLGVLCGRSAFRKSDMYDFLQVNAFDMFTEHRYIVMSLKSGFLFKKLDWS